MLAYFADLASFFKTQRPAVVVTTVNGKLSNRLFLPDRVSGLLICRNGRPDRPQNSNGRDSGDP